MNSELPKQILLQQKSSCLYERRKLQLVNVAIVGKLEDKEITSMVLEMIKIIDQIPSAIFIDPETYANLKTSNTDIDFNRISCLTSEFYEKVNVVVTIGGDGTILKALSYFQSLSPPEVLSFQKGTLGFLCAFQETDSFHQILKEELAKIYNGDNSYRQTKRRIHGKLLDGKNSEFHVLNDFVITRGNDPHILKLRISILSGKDDAKEHLLTETSGEQDGLIISTPTGSTAYSLSAGGAVISDNVNSIQMVPICPLSLSFRPIVLPSSVNIKIETRSPMKVEAQQLFGQMVNNNTLLRKGCNSLFQCLIMTLSVDTIINIHLQLLKDMRVFKIGLAV